MALKTLHSNVRHWLRQEHPKARRRRIIAGGIVLAAAWALFGGQQGLFALLMSQREKAKLRSEIARLKDGNAELQRKAALLAARPDLYERTARERLLLMRPGETLYRFH